MITIFIAKRQTNRNSKFSAGREKQTFTQFEQNIRYSYQKRAHHMYDWQNNVQQIDLLREKEEQEVLTDISVQDTATQGLQSKKSRTSTQLQQDDSIGQDELYLKVSIKRECKKLTALSALLREKIEYEILMQEQLQSRYREEMKQISTQLQQEVLRFQNNNTRQLKHAQELAYYQTQCEELKQQCQYEQQQRHMSDIELERLRKENTEAEGLQFEAAWKIKLICRN